MMLLPYSRPFAWCLAPIVSMLLAGAATAQEEALFIATGAAQEEVPPAQAEKARALLDEVKKSELDRQVAVKQTELDRLKQDLEKTERDSTGVQKTIDSMAALITDSGDNLNKLTTESRRLEHELAVAEARMAAERLKVEGLRALSAAQGKALSALARHAEETEARSRLRTAELGLLQQGKPIPAELRDDSAQGELAKARKALAAAEAKTQAEERAAHEAMKAAAAKMALAEARASTAKRLADNDLTLPPIAEKTRPKSSDRPVEKKESDAPVRKPQPAAAASTPKPAATAATATPKPPAVARPNSPPRGPFFGR
jgi:hypothetical protein